MTAFITANPCEQRKRSETSVSLLLYVLLLQRLIDFRDFAFGKLCACFGISLDDAAVIIIAVQNAMQQYPNLLLHGVFFVLRMDSLSGPRLSAERLMTRVTEKLFSSLPKIASKLAFLSR